MNTRTQDSDQLIELSAVCGELLLLGVPPPAGGVRSLQVKAGSAAFPAVKRNQRWYVRRGDLLLVAASYGAARPAERVG